MVDNVDRALISIDHKLSPLKRPLSKECCIYRVPQNLRKVSEHAYHPWVVSIGPFHYGDPKLEPMEEHKLRYWQSFLERNPQNDKSCYVKLVRDKQLDVRDCYNQHIKLDDDTFVEMVLLDAVYIIEFFVRLACYSSSSEEVGVTDHTCEKSYFRDLVIRDLQLEENQLPFFILNDLYNLVFPQSAVQDLPLINLACWVFDVEDFMPDDVKAKAKVVNFVDLLRQSYLWSILEEKPDSYDDDTNNEKKSRTPFCPSATELHEAGVIFKVVTTSKNLFDISFRDGVLAIPKLTLVDETETIFRNIMAFEQFHCHLNRYISNYFSFLNDLIDTTKDVDILVEKGIIDNWLGSNEEAAKLINSISAHITTITDNFHYSGVCKKLNKYKSRRWPKYRAILRHKYFNHPWAIISVVYAIVLLILTLLQVITGFTN